MRIALLLLLLTSTLRADALADLRAALGSLAAETPISAEVEFSFTDTNGDEKKPTTTTGHATAAVRLDDDGLQIRWSPEQLAAAARERAAAATKPGQTEPTHQAMTRLDATSLHDELDAGGELLRRLATATLLNAADTEWQGHPAKLLTLKIEPPLSAEDRKVIKEIDVSTKVWVGGDNLPLAAESSLRLKGRVMVVVGFEHTEQEKTTFLHCADRLVVATHERSTTDDGGGQHAKSRTKTTLRVTTP